MTPSRSIQSAAFALALAVTLATLGSLNLLAQDQYAGGLQARAKAAATQQAAAAAQASATSLRS